MLQTATGSHGSLALLKAVSAGRPRQVRLLLESGVGTEQADECGQTALIRACFIDNLKNRLKVTSVLLKNGAIVSKTDIVGRNALSWACLYGRDRMVQLLLEFADLELDLNQSDMNGCTAVFHAASSGSAATVKLIVDSLKKYSLTVDKPNFSGVTPLMQALRQGHDVCASILVHQGGASTTRRDKEFLSARDWAQKTDKLKKRNINDNTCKPKSTFPPIISANAANVIRYRENRARRQIGSESDEDESESDFSVNDSIEKSHRKNNSNGSLQSLTLSRSTPDITKLIDSDEIDISDDGDGCLWSSDDDDDDNDSDICIVATVRPRPTHGQLRRNRDLKKLYSLYEEQLATSYRAGYKQLLRKADSESPDSQCSNSCNLECCNAIVRPTILVTDEMIKNAVTANRQAREKKVTISLKRDNSEVRRSREHWTDLRRRIALRNSGVLAASRGQKWSSDLQIAEQNRGNPVVKGNVNNNHGNNANVKAEDKKDADKKLSTTLPSLGGGKISLVSGQHGERNEAVDDNGDTALSK